ncbi:MAG: hypothetical protein M1819_005921 [Sarea resinae]|nr:MAG: hypothetical protein M1819_005921 [Sarea resinae]
MKRPPPSSAQTSVNGIGASKGSVSPSLNSKKPPSAAQHLANAVSTAGANGAGQRVSNRQRREPQRPGDPQRQLKNGVGTGADGLDGDRRALKELPPRPFVNTSGHILRKYRGSPPSLILHLHPTHFRFDQQDGSFGYNSPMKVILEHIRAQTVPHDMLEELFASNVRFYDNCLIVQIHDHRSVSTPSSNASSGSSSDDKSIPYSIHNYNEHLTPSPYVPFPIPAKSDPAKEQNGRTKASTQEASPEMKRKTTIQGKDSMPAPARQKDGQGKSAPLGPRVFTTVLHPTALSLLAEMTIYATTPDTRGSNKRQYSAYAMNSSTPVSATGPHPPTPLTAVPSTPIGGGFPRPKRQKMMLDDRSFHDFEAKVLLGTSAGLYLDPVDGPAEAQLLLKALKDPLHESKPPPPKARKRTVAELAADEAQAAEEERFMLIMDERLAPASAGAAAGVKSTTDGQSGGASFEPRFARFKTLENIKIQHEEREKQRKEKEAQEAATKRQQQEHMERERRREFEEKQRKEQQMKEMQQRQQTHAQLAQQAKAQQQAIHMQQSGMIPNVQQQHLQQVTQGQHSSPVVRQHTPLNSSPLVGNVIASHPSVPINGGTPTQGAGSPRPPSVTQHGHPAISAAMAHQMSQQQSQQGPSRRGTPQMTQGTPNMQHATPVMRHVTPTPRMSRASPVAGSVAHTPVMNHSMMAGTPQMHAAQLTPQQQQAYIQRQHAQQQYLAQQQQQLRAAGGPQLTPQQIAQFHAQQQQQAQQAMQQQQQHPNQTQYQQQLARQMQQQMAAAARHGVQAGAGGGGQAGAAAGGGMQMGAIRANSVNTPNGRPIQQNPQNPQVVQMQMGQRAWMQRQMAQLQAQFGNNIPPQHMQRFTQHVAIMQQQQQQMINAAQMGRGARPMMQQQQQGQQGQQGQPQQGLQGVQGMPQGRGAAMQ